jgi:hypothetical protein
VSRQEFPVDTRVIVKAFQLGGRGDLEQVLIPCLVFSQQKQVVRRAVELGVTVGHAARRQISFHPDDGLDAFALRGFVKIDHPEHRAVIGDRHGRHVQFLHAFDQLLDIREAVEHGIFGVDVEVGEGHSQVVS